MHDENLKTLLLYTLAVGNYLNGNTKRCDSYGFKFSEYEKLLEVKC